MKKRVLAVTLALTVAASMMTGCGVVKVIKIGEEGKKNALKYSKESVATLWYDFIDSITKKV